MYVISSFSVSVFSPHIMAHLFIDAVLTVSIFPFSQVIKKHKNILISLNKTLKYVLNLKLKYLVKKMNGYTIMFICFVKILKSIKFLTKLWICFSLVPTE